MNNLIYVVSTGILGLLGYMFKTMVLNRLETVEQQIVSKLSDADVRRLIEDKIDPIRQDIQEIKQMQQRLLDLYMGDKR